MLKTYPTFPDFLKYYQHFKTEGTNSNGFLKTHIYAEETRFKLILH